MEKVSPIIHENGDVTFNGSFRFPSSQIVGSWEPMSMQGVQGYQLEMKLDTKSYWAPTQRELRDWLLLYEKGLV